MNAEIVFITHAYLQLSNMYIRLKKKRKSKRWRNRRWLIRPINTRRRLQGDFQNLFQEMKMDPDLFFRYTRMDVNTFSVLLRMLSPYLTKKSTKALPPEQRLAITLRYLATGDQMLSIALAYRVGESTAHAVVKETCTAIITALSPLYLQPPNEDKWKDICAGYLQHWNFPNCVGAIDGKHIQIQAPPNSGSLYYNYKKTFSIVLLAVCDYEYKFILVDVGSYGSESDSGIFQKSNLSAAFRNNTLNLPKGTAKVPGSELQTPCFFVADDAFALTEHMMKPYSKRHLSDKERIFNYRLSRARRTIENAFGILAARWRIFRKSIAINPCNADNIVVSAICLHNFLKTVNDEQPALKRIYCPPNFVDCEDQNGNFTPGAWRSIDETQLQAIRKGPPCRAARKAFQQRDALAQYFVTPEGEVPWQYDYIERGQYAA